MEVGSLVASPETLVVREPWCLGTILLPSDCCLRSMSGMTKVRSRYLARDLPQEGILDVELQCWASFILGGSGGARKRSLQWPMVMVGSAGEVLAKGDMKRG